MKLIQLLLFISFLSCNSSSDGGGTKLTPPISPEALFNPTRDFNLTNLNIGDETLINQQTLESELAASEIFNTIPLKGDSNTFYGFSKFRMEFNLGGGIPSQVCSGNYTSEAIAFVADLQSSFFVSETEVKYFNPVLEQGNAEFCATILPAVGDVNEYAENVPNYTDGLSGLTMRIFRLYESEGKQKNFNKSEVAIGIGDIYRGSFQAATVYKINYIIHDYEDGSDNPFFQFNCQVVFTSESPAFNSILANECVGGGEVSIDDDGVPFKIKVQAKNFVSR